MSSEACAEEKRTIRFNPYSPEFKEDRYAYYRHIRNTAPVLEHAGIWVITRYSDIIKVMQSKNVSVASIPATVKQLVPADIPNLELLGDKAIVFTDPPKHSRLRRLTGRSFNLKSLENFSGQIRAVINRELISALNRECDIVPIAHAIPLQAMSVLLGIPDQYVSQLDNQLQSIRRILEPALLSPKKIKRIEAELDEVIALFRNIVRMRKAAPSYDILSQLIAADIDGDQLSEDELAISCVLTYIAGHETSKGLLSSIILMAGRYPDQWAMIKNGQATPEQFIEEVLRTEPPLQQTLRKTTSTITIDEHVIPEGSSLLLCIAAGNRDEKVFSNPDAFNIQRESLPNLAFGYGMHNCIGKYLSKLEAQYFIEHLVDIDADIKIDDEGIQWAPDGMITRSLKHLTAHITCGVKSMDYRD